jgi:hypothetical protein
MNNAACPRTVAWILALLVLAGCRRDPDGPRWDVGVVGPLVNTSFTISDLVADSLLEVDANGQLTLVYRTSLFALQLDTVLEAPDTSFIYPFVMPVTGNLPAGFTFPLTNDVARFDLDGVELTRLKVRSGTLTVSIRNQIPGVVLGSYALPGAITPGGAPFSQDCIIPVGSVSNPGIFQSTTDLAGHVFDLRGPGYNDVNTLTTQLAYQLDPNGPANVPVQQGDSLSSRVGYNAIVPAYAKGYFGMRTIPIEAGGSKIDLFDDLASGTLDLDDVYATLEVRNGIGADVQVVLDRLSARNSSSNTTVDLVHPIVNAPINLNRAVDLGNAPQPALYTSQLDPGNSNLDALLEALPDSVLYGGEVRLNPLGDISNGNDFLYYESRIEADLTVRVPLRLIATDLVLQQLTFPDLPGSAEGHAIQSGTLHLFATNGFPFSAGFLLEVVNTSGTVLATIPVNGVIPSGILGTNGLVVASTSAQLSAPVSAEVLDLLYEGAGLRISTVLNTADQSQHLQLLDSYRMDLRLTVEADYMVNGDE